MTSTDSEGSKISRPRLPRGVRLKRDDVRQEWLLLAPERVLKIDAVALAVLERCDGERSIEEIVDDLARVYKAERSRIDADVRAMLTSLSEKRLLDL